MHPLLAGFFLEWAVERRLLDEARAFLFSSHWIRLPSICYTSHRVRKC
jgi:hypothetical protein